MREFIQAFLEHDDPLSALKEGRLLPRADIGPSLRLLAQRYRQGQVSSEATSPEKEDIFRWPQNLTS
jgi:hypothetical protein